MDEADEVLTMQHITITANGHTYTVPVGSTIATLLNLLKVTAKYVVVQLDGVIVPRSDFDATVLPADCKLEIIAMVGGGRAL